jgi:hypothetical protein
MLQQANGLKGGQSITKDTQFTILKYIVLYFYIRIVTRIEKIFNKTLYFQYILK